MNAPISTQEVCWFWDHASGIAEYEYRLHDELGYSPEAAIERRDRMAILMALLEERMTVTDYRRLLSKSQCAGDVERDVNQTIHMLNEVRIRRDLSRFDGTQGFGAGLGARS